MLAVLFANVQAFAMSVEQSRNEAWFLTDKMAHELRLNNYQWDDVYEVNYDFFRSLGHVTASYSAAERVREQKLRYILTVSQWSDFCRLSYFSAPVAVVNGNWSFAIYSHYNRDKFFDRNHRVVFTYSGNRTGWENYYNNRHVTTRTNSYSNSNWNNNHNNGIHTNNGNHYGQGNNSNFGNNGNRNNGNHSGTVTVASRTPNTNNGSTHVTQNNGRRH